MKVLELYSGIGGMHMALNSSGIIGEVIASVDINPIANQIYAYNFPKTQLFNRNIESLTPKLINRLDVDTILMSPPCQPFTRNGRQTDLNDQRTNSFQYLLGILPELLKIERILIENVRGFEVSEMRDLLVETLKTCGFVYQEFLLNPNQFGVPNSRQRYYCLATKQQFPFDRVDGILEYLPNCKPPQQPNQIGDLIDNDIDFDTFKLNDTILQKYTNLLDICYRDSTNSCCFTKAYSRYIEGTGSVFTEADRDYVERTLEPLKQSDLNRPENLDKLKSLKLRFFTPSEICKLMCFPQYFQFPAVITHRQRYRVLGNSINVRIVGELIKLLRN